MHTFYLSRRHVGRIGELDIGAAFLQAGDDLGDLDRGALGDGALDQAERVEEAEGCALEALQNLGGLPWPPEQHGADLEGEEV